MPEEFCRAPHCPHCPRAPRKRVQSGPEQLHSTEMYPQVDTKDSAAVEKEVQAGYLAMFPQGDRLFVSTALNWVKDCFAGNYKDYQASDARYHDLEHTLQGTLCMARLLEGRHRARTRCRSGSSAV